MFNKRKTEKQSPDTPWFRQGLRFRCRKCGGCCTGEPGYVWVTNEELEKIARAVHLDRYEFENRYVRLVDGRRKSLIELPNGDCVLFDPVKRQCRVYDARPIQCKTWPFWERNIDTPNSWRKTARFCRGCDHPEGRLYTAEEIIEQRDQRFGE
ncbi:MAG: YkgJ family cysteine cluster protein [Thermoguttaceae bacterium]|nr:YkgJ family cysteine cluster protein [Thermoguttaceae bacterium]MBR3219243.1 YkgJ family cysteine cluster protein [Thermoguttaceae bacterium]